MRGLIMYQLSLGQAQGVPRKRLNADYAIVIANGYFAGVLANNRLALKAFWVEVAEKSPIPVMIYNCASDQFDPYFD